MVELEQAGHLIDSKPWVLSCSTWGSIIIITITPRHYAGDSEAQCYSTVQGQGRPHFAFRALEFWALALAIAWPHSAVRCLCGVESRKKFHTGHRCGTTKPEVELCRCEPVQPLHRLVAGSSSHDQNNVDVATLLAATTPIATAFKICISVSHIKKWALDLRAKPS
jgi:hypothetical protein